MLTSTSKELLELEHQGPSPSNVPRILICNKEGRMPKKTRNLSHTSSGGGTDERPLTSVVSKSEVLGKVKNFLPIMAEANKQLEFNVQENPHVNYDIEDVNDDGKEYIEMDLLLGVADLQTPEAVAAAEATIDGSQPPLPSSARTLPSESDTEDSCSSDDSDDDYNYHEIKSSTCDRKKSSCTKRLESKPKKRPKIAVLN